jgi:hypothetical protein
MYLITKRIGKNAYNYLVENHRVNGKPRIRHIAYMGKHEEIREALDAFTNEARAWYGRMHTEDLDADRWTLTPSFETDAQQQRRERKMRNCRSRARKAGAKAAEKVEQVSRLLDAMKHLEEVWDKEELAGSNLGLWDRDTRSA